MKKLFVILLLALIAGPGWADCVTMPPKQCVQVKLKPMMSQAKEKWCLVKADVGDGSADVFFNPCPDVKKDTTLIGDLVQRSDITFEGTAQCKYEFKENEKACSQICTCGYLTSFEQEFKNAPAVFLGTVVSISAGGEDFKLVSFSVEKSWKAGTGLKTQIKVGRMGGYQFEVGKQYLVFASNQSPRYTHCCGLTKPAQLAMEEIKKLGPSIPLK